jgi:fatty-acyl-CoA synthase
LNERHFEFWPRRMPRTLTLPETSVYQNLKVSATRYPEKTAIVYYGTEVPYGRLHDEVNALAGYLQQDLGVEKGDRVILYMQNSPQFVISYYAILRADAVVVPVNPMLVTDELRHYAEDSGAKVALVGQELHGNISPLVGESGLERVVAAVYSDYLEAETDLAVPDVVSAPEGEAEAPCVGPTLWGRNVRRGSIRPVPKTWRVCRTPRVRPGSRRGACILTGRCRRRS